MVRAAQVQGLLACAASALAHVRDGHRLVLVDERHAAARASCCFENALQRLNWSAGRVDVVAHLVNITTSPTKVDLHVNEDDCGLRWVEVSIKREGVGLCFDLRHGRCFAALGGSLSSGAQLLLAPARTALRFLPSIRGGGGLVRGLIDLFRTKTTVRLVKTLMSYSADKWHFCTAFSRGIKPQQCAEQRCDTFA